MYLICAKPARESIMRDIRQVQEKSNVYGSMEVINKMEKELVEPPVWKNRPSMAINVSEKYARDPTSVYVILFTLVWTACNVLFFWFTSWILLDPDELLTMFMGMTGNQLEIVVDVNWNRLYAFGMLNLIWGIVSGLNLLYGMRKIVYV